MKKKLNGFHWFHFLLFAFAAMVGLNAIGKELDVFTHLDGLLARGNREYQACRDFKIEWQELEKGLEKIQLENPKRRTKEESKPRKGGDRPICCQWSIKPPAPQRQDPGFCIRA